MTVTWILESNVFAETCFDRMVAHLQGNSIPHHIIRVIPVLHEIAGKVPDVTNPAVVYGSIGTQKLTVDHGWSPGVWTNEGFSESALRARLGEHYLNHDLVCCAFRNAPKTGQFFMKPDNDTKEFAGTVIRGEECNAWAKRLAKMGYFEGNILDLSVVISTVKNIGEEWRVVIVDGEPVAASCYKQDGKTVATEGAPTDVMNFAYMMAGFFSPADVFVMDICRSRDNEYLLQVIEYNTFNSAGLYECDVGAVIDAINAMLEKADS
jgi:hypothetical protein